MRTIRIGVQLQPQHADYRAFRQAAIRAEQMGVDVIYTWDHFFPLRGDPNGKHFECWTLIAAMAEITERAEIGSLVAANSYRNPHLLADMVRTIDHISGGRVILGLGAGWAQRDYDAYGYQFGTVASRLRDLGQALPLIEQRFEKLNPPPLRKVPILIGGGGERVTLRLAAQHADIWHGFGEPETIRHKNAVLDTWCRKFGRDPSAIERSSGIDPRRLELADRLVEAGSTQLTLGFSGPDYDLGPLADWLAWRDQRNAARSRQAELR